MRSLPSRRCTRMLTERRWTCGSCLTSQVKRYNSSISTDTSRVSQPSIPLPPGQALPEDGRLSDATDGNGVTRSHLKNHGQYFVTTPIFYVNGGNSPFEVTD
jgi:hypothetical protein